jgi:hypothetical protein
VLDKCTLDSRNAAATCDTDVDGYGNACDADFDQNFAVTRSTSDVFIPAFKGLDVPDRAAGHGLQRCGELGRLQHVLRAEVQGRCCAAERSPVRRVCSCAGTAGCM